ncbi:helix-turn-helix domain-containing protein [Desulfosporosinus sp. PR]|uniref:winged helix-turn-helix transcriptional regulator n=1 Tax=Candidatus Desulfosporosinus nitrosoreducens TaxID=3401928 RepID=UPI0027F242E8|nr:helix-turn-helix domain-containing protein [Desulfosporosinus sp. PR]MDQ7092137.1 helix-turn-helix domain-containing protein [Desulfosporosinus sp. PR]
MEDYQLCPKFESAFELIGKRWTGLIIRVLQTGPKRFKELAETIPNVSGRVLTERLKELECEGIIHRHVYPEMPVRIEYSLSSKGRDLIPVFDELQKWAVKWIGLQRDLQIQDRVQRD